LALSAGCAASNSKLGPVPDRPRTLSTDPFDSTELEIPREANRGASRSLERPSHRPCAGTPMQGGGLRGVWATPGAGLGTGARRVLESSRAALPDRRAASCASVGSHWGSFACSPGTRGPCRPSRIARLQDDQPRVAETLWRASRNAYPLRRASSLRVYPGSPAGSRASCHRGGLPSCAAHLS
jgi:hypothetical protein